MIIDLLLRRWFMMGFFAKIIKMTRIDVFFDFAV